VRLVTAQGDESIYTVTWRDRDWINGHDETRDTRFPHTWFIDPRTVPAEPEDPRVAAITEALEDEYGSVSEDAEYDPREYHQAAINEIIAKLDGLALNDDARADR